MVSNNVKQSFDATDIRFAPAYTFAEAARYLRIPKSTLRAWFKGQDKFRSVLRMTDPKKTYLSFVNLVEAHVLSVIRYRHQVQLPHVRKAIGYMSRSLRTKHPLIDKQLQTDGLDLYVQVLENLINVSKVGQLTMRDLVQVYLRRIERDAIGIPIKLFPFARRPLADVAESVLTESMDVVIDPRIGFGRPTLTGTGIQTAILAQRYWAGERMDALSKDFDLSRDAIEQAIRYQTLIERAEPAAA